MIELCEPPLDLGTDCRLSACRYDTNGDIVPLIKATGIALPERLDSAVNKRKVEYISGRYCAEQSFSTFTDKRAANLLANTIHNAEDRSPIWPEGYVGAITHSHSFAAAVVASNRVIRSIGLDSEQLIKEKTADAVDSQVLTDNELFSPATAQGLSKREYLTVVFSAKESLYKCLHPIVKTFFGFDAAKITLDTSSSSSEQHSFQFELLKPLDDEFCSTYQGTGFWAFKEGFAHTAVILNPQDQHESD